MVGPAISDRYGEDMMMVEPIEFLFGKDTFKTTKVNVRDFIGVIKSETSRSNREEDDWTTRRLQAYLKSCGDSSITGFKEMCDFTVELVNVMNVITEEIFIKMNIKICPAVFQVWSWRSKKISNLLI
ncbi:hypothetical protein IGI04_018277 [Brassica rapa subsp. trilocularis]|uniref:Uncharacterized protein n=1 Tax=Brassica rapa subsp. trilocularis TaxID=1813537 RepID=A0ABQ7ME85_BRACM|nr:hypothetical protein IGI04_018277 [Brassica rapa subsp. trilocularis]